MNTKHTIIEFIMKNGWEFANESNEWNTYTKKDNIVIDISDRTIVLIDDNGPFEYIPLNGQTLYYMLGYFIQHSFIAIDYKWIK